MEPAVMPGGDITAHRPGPSPPPLRVWVSLNVPETHAGPTGRTRLWNRGQFCVSREHSPRWLGSSTSSPERERSCQSDRGTGPSTDARHQGLGNHRTEMRGRKDASPR